MTRQRDQYMEFFLPQSVRHPATAGRGVTRQHEPFMVFCFLPESSKRSVTAGGDMTSFFLPESGRHLVLVG